jgi:hypothetical protein
MMISQKDVIFILFVYSPVNTEHHTVVVGSPAYCFGDLKLDAQRGDLLT